MKYLFRHANNTYNVRVVYLLNLFISFHYFLVLYVNSSFLNTFISQRSISMVYIVGSVLSVLLFTVFIRLVNVFGNYRLTLSFLLLEVLSLLGLALFPSVSMVLAAFTLFLIISPILYLSLDVFIERDVQDGKVMGKTRGIFLTMINVAQVSSPLIAGFVLRRGQFQHLYYLSVFFLVLSLIVSISFLRKFKDSAYVHYSFDRLIERFKGSKAFNEAFFSQFILRFFYAWMVIYVPLYLHTVIGFSLPQMGILFTIMLVPFLILELPLGVLADTIFNQAIMTRVGFLIMTVSVVLIPFVHSSSIVLWAGILFLSRIGASFTEVAAESFFFKNIDQRSVGILSLYRMSRPFTYVAAACVASVTVLVLSVRWSFLILAAVLFIGFFCTFFLSEKTKKRDHSDILNTI